jgi:hypothetical protein
MTSSDRAAHAIVYPAATSGDSNRSAALISIAVLGVAVALASEIPLPLRSLVLVVAVSVAMVLVCVESARLVRAAFAGPVSRSGRIATTLGVVGIATAALFAIQPELVRAGRPAFTWIVDWRYALNHARAIARSGGVDRALDYAGAGLDYHVGPAWIAGAAERLLGVPAEPVLFGIIPLVCVLAIALSGIAILSNYGVPRRIAAAAVGLMFAIPQPHRPIIDAAYSLPASLIDPESWPNLPTSNNLNSVLGLAVAGCSLALLLNRRYRLRFRIIGALGLAAVMQIKPQYFVGFGLVVGVVGIARSFALDPAAGRSPRVLVAAGLALALALLQRAALPGYLPVIATPRWAGSAGNAVLQEWNTASTVLGVVTVGCWLLARSRRAAARRASPMALLAASALAIAAIALALYLVDFPLVGDVFGRAQALQLNDATPTHLERDIAQAFIPPRMLLLECAFALLAIAATEAGSLAGTMLFGVLGTLVVVSPLPHLVLGFAAPADDRYSVAEDGGLLAVLARVPRDGSLLISSDLADPAQNYRRPLRGILLTAYRGHAYYVSNIRYGHYARPDAPERVLALRAFFGAPWSPWHDRWLAATGVTHVLADDRCIPAWHGAPQVPLREVARAGHWRAYELHARPAEEFRPSAQPRFRELVPTYGRSECLLGRHRAGM